MKKITKRQIIAVLNAYKEAYQKCKDMSAQGAIEFLINHKLHEGLCLYIECKFFTQNIKNIDYSCLGIPSSEYVWATPTMIYRMEHPSNGLIPRIKFLEKFINQNYK